ncbi:bifunctional riboflavin kinase/FAD synthetase [Insulibacter thermoxylanivorax]|nr:bifunctional riboflavin kinase/FAD synthetase [Insulibacter thermoxylanivorax]
MDIRRIQYPFTELHSVPPDGQVIAIGDFDGVHLGHREVISRAIERARSLGVPAAIMTFDPHPREVLGKAQYSRILTPIDEKMRLFAELGVDQVYIVHFTPELARVSPEDYYKNMLYPLKPRVIVVGFDFTFGHRGQGTAETLAKLAKAGESIEVIAPHNMDGEKISSTLIREQLHLGRLERVKSLLGRHYRIQGKVVKGEGRGRKIGYPTANLEPLDRYVIPRQGVYAVRVYLDGETLKGVMNIGIKPTFHEDEEQPPTLEVHILDRNEDLYGRTLEIEFAAYLRPEMKFSSVEMLIEQIAKDAQRAKQILA